LSSPWQLAERFFTSFAQKRKGKSALVAPMPKIVREIAPAIKNKKKNSLVNAREFFL
jgi:hypothetical protein